jgi:hypothetical protein
MRRSVTPADLSVSSSMDVLRVGERAKERACKLTAAPWRGLSALAATGIARSTRHRPLLLGPPTRAAGPGHPREPSRRDLLGLFEGRISLLHCLFEVAQLLGLLLD